MKLTTALLTLGVLLLTLQLGACEFCFLLIFCKFIF